MSEIYRINLDKKWKLSDLYEFPHAYSQIYAFYYFFSSDKHSPSAISLEKVLKNYKIGNQYRYVNLYSKFHNLVPKNDRPVISSIHYASPGWLDLILNSDIAFQIAKSSAIFLGLGVTVAKTYSTIYKILGDINKERNKQKLDTFKLTKQQNKELIEMSNDFAKLIGFQNVKAIDDVTENPELTLKILLAQYRRLEKMGDYIKSGNIVLSKKDSIDG